MGEMRFAADNANSNTASTQGGRMTGRVNFPPLLPKSKTNPFLFRKGLLLNAKPLRVSTATAHNDHGLRAPIFK